MRPLATALLSMLAAAGARAQGDAVLTHTAPAEVDAHGSVRIEATIKEAWEPVKLVVNVRRHRESKFERVPMGVEEIRIEGSGAATIAAGNAGELLFYIEALDLAGSVVASDGSARKPHFVKVASPLARRRRAARERWKEIGGGVDPCRPAKGAGEIERLTGLAACAEIDFERWYGKVRKAARGEVDAYEEAEVELDDLGRCALGGGEELLAFRLRGLQAASRVAEAVAGVSVQPLLKTRPDPLSSADARLKSAADKYGTSEACRSRAADLIAAHDRWTAAREGVCNQLPRPRRNECKHALDAVRAERLAELGQAAARSPGAGSPGAPAR